MTQGTERRDVPLARLPSLRRKLAADSGWAFGGRALTVAIGFATSVLLTRLLSPREFALVMSISGAASAVAAFGLPTTGTRLIAEAVATGRPGRARAVARWVLAVSGGIAAGIALVGISPPAKAVLWALFDIPGLEPAVDRRRPARIGRSSCAGGLSDHRPPRPGPSLPSAAGDHRCVRPVRARSLGGRQAAHRLGYAENVQRTRRDRRAHGHQ